MKITVEGQFSDETEMLAVRYILRDALSAFMNARKGDYVERRYGSHPDSFKEMKRKNVQHRLELAQKLFESDIEMMSISESK